MLQIENLHAEVDGKPILKGLTLSLNPGEIHAIMGPNGAGKSTLSYVLAGRDGYEVTDGSVTFNGQDLLALDGASRMNKPATCVGNWCWRLTEQEFEAAAAAGEMQKMKELNRLFGRTA